MNLISKENEHFDLKHHYDLLLLESACYIKILIYPWGQNHEKVY